MGTTKAKRAETAARRTEAIRLRNAGILWEDIAERLGYASRGAACTDVNRALKANLAAVAEEVDIMRHRESERYDMLQAALWDKAMAGDVKAVEAVLKVSDRRTKLFGLDAPVRTEMTVTVPASEQERREQLAKLGRLAQYAVTGDAEAILAADDQEPEQ